MKRIILLIVAGIVVILLIIGIVVALANFFGSKTGDTTTKIGQPESSSADNSPVDKSSDGAPATPSPSTSTPSTPAPAPTQSSTPTTIPSTGPTDTAAVLLTAGALAVASYGAARLVQVRIRK